MDLFFVIYFVCLFMSQIVLISLRITNVVSWSWIWIISPVWINSLLLIAFIVFMYIWGNSVLKSAE